MLVKIPISPISSIEILGCPGNTKLVEQPTLGTRTDATQTRENPPDRAGLAVMVRVIEQSGGICFQAAPEERCLARRRFAQPIVIQTTPAEPNTANEVGSGTSLAGESDTNAAPETFSVVHPGNWHGPVLAPIVIEDIRTIGDVPSRGCAKWIKT